ncbi:MAG: hypothetical protein MRY83_23565 [Flavobacteriales bacterium]|nr:hypothetical protein [Flavobacteriales bacterium]
MRFAFFIWSLLLVISVGCKRDVCDEVICRNDGYCDDGSCQCADGFKGLECQTQKTPQKIVIENLTINSYPETGNWDPQSPTDGSSDANPDIYVMLYQHGNLIYDGSENVLTDFTQSLPVELGVEIHKEGYDAPIKIEIYDRDFGGRTDQLVYQGTLSELYSKENKFPKSLAIDAQGASSEVSVAYTW